MRTTGHQDAKERLRGIIRLAAEICQNRPFQSLFLSKCFPVYGLKNDRPVFLVVPPGGRFEIAEGFLGLDIFVSDLAAMTDEDAAALLITWARAAIYAGLVRPLPQEEDQAGGPPPFVVS